MGPESRHRYRCRTGRSRGLTTPTPRTSTPASKWLRRGIGSPVTSSCASVGTAPSPRIPVSVTRSLSCRPAPFARSAGRPGRTPPGGAGLAAGVPWGRGAERRLKMAVVSVEITERAPFAGGAEPGGAGPYERVDGVLTYAVDPANPVNALITDLALAPRSADGLVRFSGDFTLIAPVDRERGNGELLIDVVNRGRRQVMPTFNLAPPSRVGSSEVPLGDGFLCRRGYTVLSVGWQWDVPAQSGDDGPRGSCGFREREACGGAGAGRDPARRAAADAAAGEPRPQAVSSGRRRRAAGPAAGEGLGGWAVPGDSAFGLAVRRRNGRWLHSLRLAHHRRGGDGAREDLPRRLHHRPRSRCGRGDCSPCATPRRG